MPRGFQIRYTISQVTLHEDSLRLPLAATRSRSNRSWVFANNLLMDRTKQVVTQRYSTHRIGFGELTQKFYFEPKITLWNIWRQTPKPQVAGSNPATPASF